MQVEQKWGFGMAPVKLPTQLQRERAVAATHNLLFDRKVEDGLPEQLSEVKGLFSRAHRQDQWDWFTVWTQLGRPGRNASRQAAGGLAGLRRAVVAGDLDHVEDACRRLEGLRTGAYLDTFLNGGATASGGVGYLYVLSTREQPSLLKIGYTDRTVEERVREINASTGVAVPFGVRAVWAVREARTLEGQVHEALAPFRVRNDREFFDLDFYEAFDAIMDLVAESRREL